ncbi:MAG: 3-oxoacyl-ACP reductase FabG [Firmicutes bacterium]|nr:3-oxoacyl-ACP reductase FabG [Bacillota bacterium]
MITGMEGAFSLKGKTAFITGGNRGIGKGIALAMAQSGANVAIMARAEKKAEETLAELAAWGGTHRFYKGDVTDFAGAKAAVEKAIEDYGKIDILVNNSGIARVGPVLDMDENLKDWYDVINVNLHGVFVMSYLVGRHMRDTGGGVVINISSNAAQIVNLPLFHSAYSTAKAGVDRLTKMLAVEWAPYNIRVNAIAPGYTYSDLMQKGEEHEGFLKEILAKTPTGRFGEPIEVGALAVFLASEAAGQITGAVVTIDGGYSLPR